MAEALWQELESNWLQGNGPQQDIVVSTRVRLARNLEGIPFPAVADEKQREKVISLVEAALPQLQVKAFGPPLKLLRLAAIAPHDRGLLVAKHLISRELAEGGTRAVILNTREDISIMVNEEDHLRIQTILSGLQLGEAWELASLVDDALEGELDYAFSPELGYLTACPTNVGTGIRVSLMLHLPALTMANQLRKLVAGLTQLGLAVRGLYGEGTEGVGDMYQISNQVTLGRKESEILENLSSVTQQIITQERQARQALLKDARYQIEDRVSRANGVLHHARLLSGEEAYRLLSDVRLGVTAGLLKEPSLKVLNELLVVAQPVYVERTIGRELPPGERDYYRAALIREKLAGAGH